MPRPAIPHATIADQPGTAPPSTSAIPSVPTVTRRNPIRTSGAGPTPRTVRSWIHAPLVHATVPAVSASPEMRTLSPRSEVTVSGTNTSAAKNANVSSPRASTAAGSAPRAVSVPGGSKRRSEGTPTVRPAASMIGVSTRSRACSAASTRAAPAATAIASRTTRRGARRLPWTARSSRSAKPPATRTRGSKPRNTHRQESRSAITTARAGPAMPGTTHAVERIANMRGRNESGYVRPMTT